MYKDVNIHTNSALAAFMGCVLLSIVLSANHLRPTALYSLGGRGAPYYPESFGGFPRPYSEHRRLSMVEYMPMNETSWWDFSG